MPKWFNHVTGKWQEFKKKCFNELNDKIGSLKDLFLIEKSIITLIYSAKDKQYNDEAALKEYLDSYVI